MATLVTVTGFVVLFLFILRCETYPIRVWLRRLNKELTQDLQLYKKDLNHIKLNKVKIYDY